MNKRRPQNAARIAGKLGRGKDTGLQDTEMTRFQEGGLGCGTTRGCLASKVRYGYGMYR